MSNEEKAEICYECSGYGYDYRWDNEIGDYISNCEDCWINDFWEDWIDD